MGKTFLWQRITHFMAEYQVIKMPVCKGSLESGLRNVLIILRSLNHIMRWSIIATTLCMPIMFLCFIHLNSFEHPYNSHVEGERMKHLLMFSLCYILVMFTMVGIYFSIPLMLGLAKKLALVNGMCIEVSIFPLGTKSVRGLMCFTLSRLSFWPLPWEECAHVPEWKHGGQTSNSSKSAVQLSPVMAT